MRVDLGSLATLFPAQPEPSTSDVPTPLEPKILITTSPGKPSGPLTKDFLDDLQALLGGKSRADIVPRRSPKFELGKVARWARGRGYGAIAVVGEDHQKPSESSPRCGRVATDVQVASQRPSLSRSSLMARLRTSALRV